jgi:hypothetical protein
MEYLHAPSLYSEDEVFICKDCNRLNPIVTIIMLQIIENYVKNEQNYVTIIEITVQFIRHSQISYL